MKHLGLFPLGEKMSSEDELFLFNVSRQTSDNNAFNYIASLLNRNELALRKLLVDRWLRHVNYFLGLFDRLTVTEFETLLDRWYYNGKTLANDEGKYNLNMFHSVKSILESIEYNKTEILLLGNGTFYEMDLATFEKPDPIFRIEEDKRRFSEFYNIPSSKQIEIINFYNEYREKYEMVYANHDIGGVPLDDMDDIEIEAIEETIKSVINKRFVTSNNKEAIERYLNILQANELKETTEQDVVDGFNEFVHIETNLTVTAYYLHYCLVSMGIDTISDPDKLNIRVINKKNIDEFQRTLCSITTKNTKNLSSLGNSTYYRAINKLFKFEKGYDTQKENVLRHLSSTKELLLRFGMTKAIDLLEADFETIQENG